MPKRSAEDPHDATTAAERPDERPTVRPLSRFAGASAAEASEHDASHERVRPKVAQLMSAFANYLAESQPPVEPVAADGVTCRALLLEMSKLFSQADFDGALAVADAIAASHPAHDAVAYCARTCRTELEGSFRERLGRLDHAPRHALAADELLALDLDHREAFLLSQIDGQTSFDALVDVSPLPRFVTLRLLERLLSLGVIE